MFKKILFCADFSEDSHWAFTYAFDLVKTYKAELLILHVTPEPVHPEQLSLYLAPEKLEELKASQKKEIDQQLKTHYIKKMGQFNNYQIFLKEGEPFVEIIQKAKKESVDLIVMGTHGRTISPFLDRIYKLYLETVSRGPLAFGAHNRLFFEKICERVPDAEYTLYFVQEELGAFNLLVVKQEAMVDKYFCMDYELGHKYNLYVLSWFENVRYCVERKIPLYHAGQGAEKTKEHLGATFIPSFLLFKHRQPLIDRFLIAWPAVSEKVLSHLGFWPRADRSTSLFAALIRPRRRREIHDQRS